MNKIVIAALIACMPIIGQAQSISQMEQKNIRNMENLTLTKEWDKTFPQSDKVNHTKVTFINRYGITLAADMYVPKNVTGKLPAIAVCGPFGAVNGRARFSDYRF